MARQLKCHSCGHMAPPNIFRAHGMHCSKECVAAHEAKTAQVQATLIEAGFKQHSDTPNLFIKDGVGISLEAAQRGNLNEVLQRHARVVAKSRR